MSLKFNEGRQRLLLIPNWKEGVEVVLQDNYVDLQLRNPSLETLGGKEYEFQKDAPGIVKANSHIVMNFGTINPTKYEIEVAINPELSKYGIFTNPGMYTVGKGDQQVSITMWALKQFDIRTISWVMSLFAKER